MEGTNDKILADIEIGFSTDSPGLWGIKPPDKDRDPGAYEAYLKFRKAALYCSNGTLHIRFETRLYAGITDLEGFSDRNEEGDDRFTGGSGDFGAWAQDHATDGGGRLAFEAPPIWQDKPTSGAGGAYTFTWDSDCDGNYKYSLVGGPILEPGPQRDNRDQWDDEEGVIYITPQEAK